MCSLANLFSMAQNPRFFEHIYHQKKELSKIKQSQSNVKFDNSNLKELVKAHINPVCIITGRKIDEPNNLIDSI